jgi:uncharacterized protein YbjT (DUF2867 family)
LVQAGVRPTVVMRDPAKLAEGLRDLVEVKQGDLNDADFVASATEGADALFAMVTTSYTAEDPVAGMLTIGRNFARAIEKNKIGRTVFLSSAGADMRGNSFIGALGKVQDMLDAAGENVLHLQPGYFFTNLLMSLEELKHGTFSNNVPVGLSMPWNDPRDIGEIVAARLLATDWWGISTQAVQGPRHLSFAEVAEIASAASGKQITAHQITDDQLREGMLSAGFTAGVAQGFVDMGSEISTGKADNHERSFITTTPTTLEAWCYANLRPALNG